MVNQHIITFRDLLKELEEDTVHLRDAIFQIPTLASALRDTCTALDQTCQSMKGDAEKI